MSDKFQPLPSHQSKEQQSTLQNSQTNIHSESPQKCQQAENQKKQEQIIVSESIKVEQNEKESEETDKIKKNGLSSELHEEKENIINVFESLINQAIVLKNKGNEYFKSRNFLQAIRLYSEALRILDPKSFTGATPFEVKKMAQLSSNLLYNLGTCYYNSYDWKKAQIFYNEAIIINNNYVKALHKRALTRYELKAFDIAFDDIKLAFSLDKTNVEIHESYKKILEEYNKERKKEKETMKELSGKIFKQESQRSATNTPPETERKMKKDKQNKYEFNIPSAILAAGVIGFAAYKWFTK